MAYEQVTLRVTGRLPLIMHSNRGVNPRDPLAQALKGITSKRTKTDEDLDQIIFLEWQLGLYYDDKTGPYLQPSMIHACLRDAAKRSKQGKTVTAAIWIEPVVDAAFIPLEYEGPRDIDGLFAEDSFVDTRPAGVNGKTIMRTRPIFRQWAATFTVTYDAESINRDDVIRIAEQAGQRVGLGDYRPTYGRFTVAVLDGAKGGR